MEESETPFSRIFRCIHLPKLPNPKLTSMHVFHLKWETYE